MKIISSKLLSITTYLVLFVVVFANTNSITNLTSCAGSSIQIYNPSQSFFYDLKNHNFKNNYVTAMAIALPTSEDQVATLVKCATKYGIGICARSGGHSYLGTSQCAGLVIDLSSMRSILVNANNYVATIQPGAILGEILWALKGVNQWMSAGVCPTVGISGYLLGGGHGAYEGKLGLGCDSLQSVRMVTSNGEIITASQNENKELFWSMCGAGGGQFGIITSFTLKTVSSASFDRGVVFRYLWPRNIAGEVIQKWQDYDEDGGNVWTRMEISMANSQSGVVMYGACYNVDTTDECISKLQKGSFFNVSGRNTLYLSKVNDVLDLHAFMGPSGNWARNRATNVTSAFLDQRGNDYGSSNSRTTQSSFLSYSESAKPSKQFWQEYVDFCQSPSSKTGSNSIPWMVCQLNLFHNAVSYEKDNAFPYRSSEMLTQLIIGGGSDSDKSNGYTWMKDYLESYTTGVYVNYPENELENDYSKAYWGSSLSRLQALKQTYDPNQVFINPQSIPLP